MQSIRAQAELVTSAVTETGPVAKRMETDEDYRSLVCPVQQRFQFSIPPKQSYWKSRNRHIIEIEI